MELPRSSFITVRTLDRVGSYRIAMQDLLAGFTDRLSPMSIRQRAGCRAVSGRSTPFGSRVPRPFGDALAFLVSYDKLYARRRPDSWSGSP